MKRDRMQREALDNQIRLKLSEGKAPELFSDVEKRRNPLSQEAKRCVHLGVALLLLFFLSYIFVQGGPYALSEYASTAQMAESVTSRVSDLVRFFSGSPGTGTVSWGIFIYLSTLAAGLMLSLAGTCFQSAFQNPMASPTMLGVQSGGALGSIVWLEFFYDPLQNFAPMLAAGTADGLELLRLQNETMSLFQKVGQYLFTVIGCTAVVVMVMLMAKIAGRGRISTVPLMVGGTIFSSCISKIVNLVEYYEVATGGDETIVDEVQSLQAGAFEPVWYPLYMAFFMLTAVPPIILALAGRNRLNVLTYGEEEARALGISVRNARVYYIVVSTLLTASVIAFCGNIAFIGLIVPHIARFFVGNDFRYLAPASACLGGIFLLGSYDVSLAFFPTGNAGLVVSVAGSILFAVFMVIYRRRGNADWA